MTGRRGGAGSQAPLPLLSSLGFAASLATAGCAGGIPLLTPARTLGAGDVRAMAGFSSNFAVGSVAAAQRDAVNDGAAAAASGQAPAAGDVTYAKGALVAAAVGPGIAPVAGAHVGVGDDFEGGLVFTGRAFRVDFRRSFRIAEMWDLSVGAGGSAILYGRNDGNASPGVAAVPGVDLGHLHGWGADVPVLVGFQSDGDLYMLWAGLRGGWQHVDIGEESSQGATTFGAPPLSLSATEFWGGGVVGCAVGFRHVHLALELDASYDSVTGEFNGAHAHVGGATLMPASALWWKF